MKESIPTKLQETLNKLHYSSRRVAMELTAYSIRDNIFSLDFIDGHLDDVIFDLGEENCLSLNEICQQLLELNIIYINQSIEKSQTPKFDLNLSLNQEYLEILTEELESL